MSKPDYDTTLARIAGNIASGMAHEGDISVDSYRHKVAVLSVMLSRQIVAEVKRTAVDQDRKPTTP